MDDVSDTKIRSQVQQVLARHWIDMEKTNFLCVRGTLRMLGEIERSHASGGGLDATKLHVIERDLEGVRGVRRVHFDFENWRRTEAGGWRPVTRGRSQTARPEQPEGDDGGDVL